MALFIDNQEINDVVVDSVPVDAVTIDGEVVWNRAPPVDLSGVPALIYDYREQNQGTPRAGYRIVDTAKHYAVISTGNQVLAPDWLVRGVAGDYEVRFTLESGDSLDPASDLEDVWLSITDRYWTVSRQGLGASISHCTLAIRMTGTVDIIATTPISLEAEVETP